MKKRGKAVVWAMLGLPAAGAVLFAVSRRSQAPSGDDGQTANTDEAAPVRDRGGAVCTFDVGQDMAYDVSVETTGTTHLDRLGLGAGAQAGSGPLKSAMHARMDMRALSTGQSGTVFLTRYDDIQTQQDRAYLDAPFLLKIDDRCKITGYARKRGTPIAAARGQQVIAHELQWQHPDRGVAGDGSNGVGHFMARYGLSHDSRSIEREIVTYTAVWGAAPAGYGPSAQGVPAPKASQLVVERGSSPWFTALRGFEKVAGISVVDAETRTYARQIAPRSQALSDALADETGYVWEDLLPRLLSARPGHEVTKAELEARERARHLTFEQGVRQYLDLAKNEPNFANVWPPLTAFLETHPELTKKFGEALRDGEIPTQLAAPAYVALGQARTTEARDLLLDFMRTASTPVLDRSRSAFALIDRDDVGAPLTVELARSALSIGTGATRPERLFARESALAMGAMAGMRGEYDPDVMSAAVTAVPSLLQLGNDATTLSPVFGAIANMGNIEMLEQVRPFTQHSDARVRAAAAKVFRRMQPGQTHDMAGAWLARETDPEVKRVLYTTIVKQTRDAGEPAARAVVDQAIADLGRKPGIIARKAMVRIVGGVADTYAPAKDALIRQLAFESKEKNGLYDVVAEFLSPDDIHKGVGL